MADNLPSQPSRSDLPLEVCHVIPRGDLAEVRLGLTADHGAVDLRYWRRDRIGARFRPMKAGVRIRMADVPDLLQILAAIAPGEA